MKTFNVLKSAADNKELINLRLWGLIQTAFGHSHITWNEFCYLTQKLSNAGQFTIKR